MTKEMSKEELIEEAKKMGKESYEKSLEFKLDKEYKLDDRYKIIEKKELIEKIQEFGIKRNDIEEIKNEERIEINLENKNLIIDYIIVKDKYFNKIQIKKIY